MKRKPTPGPWRASKMPSGDWMISAPEGDPDTKMASWEELATVYQPDGCAKGKAKANARLIAAAPELLAALKAAIEPASRTPDTWAERHARAKAAIDKAEGRS